ncbi:MAG TPA: DinB family protein [Rhodanobacteraceae bacterium]|nr:DinB family protein [Rhodanobacteraceae bacterium]
MSVPSQHLEMLARYKAWADERLYAMLAGLSVDQLAAPTPIFAGSILRTLNHVHLMDVVWKSHLLRVPHDLATRNPEATPSFPELRDAQRDIDAWYVDYTKTMTPDGCNEVVHFAFIGGGEGALRREDIVLHVVNHTTYHRGHVTAMLNQLGMQPQATDLPVFLRETRSSLPK